MSNNSLLAFKVDGRDDLFNVWDYSGPSTKCVLFCYKANSEADALDAAKKLLEDNE